ncbi:MAG: DNA translocase FtsK [Muribaculaceae bacterium]|nr:DNA translocase FtsK [Muribaculaceae bacterium]
MAQEFYNPDVANNDIYEESSAGNKASISESNGRAANETKVKSSTRQRMRYLLCLIIGLVGFAMFVAFISYMRNAAADQSAVLNYAPGTIAQEGIKVKNVSGALGAWISELFISKWIGLGSFVVAIWLMLMAYILKGARRLKFYSTTIISLTLVILLSLCGGYITLHYPTAINYGGNMGTEATRFLIAYVGDFGIGVIYLGLLGILAITSLGVILRGLRKVRKILPARKVAPEATPSAELFTKENDEVSEKQEESAEFEPATIDFKVEETIVPDNETETLEVANTNTEDNHADYSEYMPKDESATDDTSAEEINGTITQAPPVEKAETILEPIDPTKELPHYKFPTVDLLKVRSIKTHNVDFEEQEANKRRITEVLGNYGVSIKTINACIGPTVTLFEIVPADGVKIAKIKSLENDIALSIAALGIRIIAPIPGKGTIGIEVPNREPQIVSMRSVLESKTYQESTAQLPMALGCTISNEVFVADLCKMPHLLVAGATGQGKSVGLNAIITSLIYRKHPAELKFVLFDPKMVEFSLYERLQHHYLAKLPGDDPIIITDSNKAIATLNSLVSLMEQRYMLLKEANVRNIELYNKKYVKRYLNPEKGHHFMPYIVVIIDEFADFISVAGRDVEEPISRIAQKARAVGIHMIIATQRPSANVITGKIKANFPGRISFRVSSMVDSRTIIDCSGAQQLVGKGDLLFTSGGDLTRLQCAFMDDDETIKLCEYIDSQVGYAEPFELPEYVPSTEGGGSSSGESYGGGGFDRDPLLPEVAAYISGMEKASTSAIQRHFRIGYNRAGSIMDQLEAIGIVGPATGGKPRQVLVDPSQISQMI